MKAGRLPRDAYARPATQVAPELLGAIFTRPLDGHLLRGRIVETEAYEGRTDPGSHAFRGRTRRTDVMFGPPGHLYVYFTYGMHHCMNVVTDADGVAGAVLIRALEPLDGLDVMQRLRGPRKVEDLCNGPAKLCQALGIDRSCNGVDLEGDEMWVESDGFVPTAIQTTTRIGLTAGADRPLRYFLEGNPFVSPGRPSGARAARVRLG